MELIPAVDLLQGQVVRLEQGRYDAVTVYSGDPAAMALSFEAQGARRLHVVDLDGARDGEPGNVSVIEEILRRTTLKVQVGGGIRSRESAERWLDAGAQRVVLGTAAVKDSSMVEALCAEHSGALVIAIDARGGEVAVEGWLERTGRDVVELAQQVDSWGAAAVLFTCIERDGMKTGPDVDATAALQAKLRATVIASGGIGSLEHLEALGQAGVRAAVCGRALYSGAFELADAMRVAEAH